MATFLERAAHSVDRMFSLYFDDFFNFNYFPFWFLEGVWELIAPITLTQP